jgi:tetratricopeptide (TPR) repeat protein
MNKRKTAWFTAIGMVLCLAGKGNPVFADALDDAIASCGRQVEQSLAKGTRVAVLGFDTDSLEFSTYLMEEVMGRFIAGKKLVVTDRQNIQLLQTELAFNSTMYIDGQTAQNFGKMIGSQAVVTGRVTDTGRTLRLEIKAFNTETAGQSAQSQVEIPKDRGLTETLAGIKSSRVRAKLQNDYNTEMASGAYAIVAGSEEYMVHFINGRQFRNIKRHDDAIAEFTRAISLNPVFGFAYHYRALSYDDKGDSGAAINNYNFLVNLLPNLWYVYNDRGVLYEKTGDLTRAMADYNKAISLDPGQAIPYNNRGNIYAENGEFDRAITDYTKAIAVERNLRFPREETIGTAYNNRGLKYEKKYDYDRAISDYTEAIKWTPRDAEPYINRGFVYNLLGDWENALADFTEAARMDPGNPDAAKNAETMRRKLGR